ncbi:MAG: hypothetical protein ACK559_33650, partial [bacterium]
VRPRALDRRICVGVGVGVGVRVGVRVGISVCVRVGVRVRVALFDLRLVDLLALPGAPAPQQGRAGPQARPRAPLRPPAAHRGLPPAAVG